MAVEPILLGTAIATTVVNLAGARRDPVDFSVFRVSAVALRTGHDPYAALLGPGYNPNTNPPAALLAFWPFAWLSTPDGAVIWSGLGLLAFAVSVHWIAAAICPGRTTTLALAALTTQAAALTLRFGQVSFLLMPLLTCAWLADRADRGVSAGAWLGVVTYLKPFFGLYAVYLLWRGEKRGLAALVGSYVTCGTIGLLAVGFPAHRTWVETLQHMGYQTPNVVNGSLRAISARLLTGDGAQPIYIYTPVVENPALELAVWGTLITIVALATSWSVHNTAKRDRQWAIVGLAALLLSPLGWIYYLPVLLGPLVASVIEGRHWRLAWIVGGCLSIPATILGSAHYGVVGTATIGSIYAWAVVGLWAGLCRPVVMALNCAACPSTSRLWDRAARAH